MLRRLRRLVRRVIPRGTHPLLDGPVHAVPRDVDFDRAYAGQIDESSFLLNDQEYVRGRYSEARRMRGLVAAHLPLREGVAILDIGGGNGALELAFSAAGCLAVSVDVLWNETAHKIHRAAGIRLRRVIADAEHLPFRPGRFDAVTSVDTFEHLRNAGRVAAEAGRVLRSGGIVLVTTPPRLRYLLRPDPHFGIRGLVSFPPSLQRWVARKKGFGDLYHVEKIFTSVPQIARLFPHHRVLDVVSRSRAPKRFFWDAILLVKN